MAFVMWVVMSIVLLLPLGLHLIRRSSDIFAPPVIFLSFAAMEFILRGAFLLFAQESFEFPQLITECEFQRSLALSFLYIAIAYVVLLLGYYNPFAQGRPIRLHKPSREYLQLIVVATIGLLGVAYILYFRFVAEVGGLSGLILTLHHRIELLAGRHYELTLIRWVYIAPLLLFAIVTTNKTYQHWRWIFAALTVFGSLLMATFGGRGRALMPLLMLVVLWHYLVHSIRLRTLLVLAIAFIISSNAILAMRLASRQAKSIEEIWLQMPKYIVTTHFGSLVRYLVSEFTALDGIIVLEARMPDELSWQFRLPLNAIAVVIPRKLWRDKPTGNPGTIFSQYWLPYNPSAKSVGHVGAAYMIFHLPAVVLLFFLNGILIRRLYITFIANKHHPLLVVGYVFVLISSRHLLIPPYENLFIHIVPLCMLAFIATLLSKSVRKFKSLANIVPKIPLNSQQKGIPSAKQSNSRILPSG